MADHKTWWNFWVLDKKELGGNSYALVSVRPDSMFRGLLEMSSVIGAEVSRVLVLNQAERAAPDGSFTPLPAPGIIMIPWNRVLMIQAITEEAAGQATLQVIPLDTGREVRPRPKKRYGRM